MAGLMIGVAGPSRAQDAKAPDKDKAPATCPPTCNWTNDAEYKDAVAAQSEPDPAKRLAALEKWKKDFPATDPALLVVRQDMFLVAYSQTQQPRQAFDQALDILKTRPNDFLAFYATVQMAPYIKPAPTPMDLDISEKNANMMLDNPDKVFDPANKPTGMSDADWAKQKAAAKPFAEQQLMTIYALRKDDKRAVDDLRKLIVRDPNLAVASYQMGRLMITLDKAENKQDYTPALYQIARALDIEGPTALPANQKGPIQTYLGQAYTAFHGSADGLDDLLKTAKNSPFPPPGYTIKSTVDIATEKEAARKKEQDADPLMFLWVHTIKEALAMQGDSFFDANVKDAGLPPPDDKTTPPTPQYFTAHIISMTPDPKPKEIVVGIEKADVADAKLTFGDAALPGKMDVGETIQFTGAAKDWNHDPKNIIITFDVDPKEGLKGWTGKNAPAGRAGGTKGGAPKGGATKGTAPH
jgi:tetratricopeptide (TPR) repeat protein